MDEHVPDIVQKTAHKLALKDLSFFCMSSGPSANIVVKGPIMQMDIVNTCFKYS